MDVSIEPDVGREQLFVVLLIARPDFFATKSQNFFIRKCLKANISRAKTAVKLNHHLGIVQRLSGKGLKVLSPACIASIPVMSVH